MAMSEQPQVHRDNQPRPDDSAREIVRRHKLPTRIWHWLNALTVFVMRNTSRARSLISPMLVVMCYQLPGTITKDGKPIIGGLDIDTSDFTFMMAGPVFRERSRRA